MFVITVFVRVSKKRERLNIISLVAPLATVRQAVALFLLFAILMILMQNGSKKKPTLELVGVNLAQILVTVLFPKHDRVFPANPAQNHKPSPPPIWRAKIATQTMIPILRTDV